MAQRIRANSTGKDSAVRLHLEDEGHSFEDRSEHNICCSDWQKKIGGLKEVNRKRFISEWNKHHCETTY